MKKLLLSIVLFVLTTSCFSQSEGFKIKGGVNLSGVTKLPGIGPGLQFGISSSKRINQKMLFAPSLEFSLQNNSNVVSKYFTLIIPADFYINKETYLSAGAYTGMFYGAYSGSDNISAEFKSFDIGLSPAIGTQITPKVSVELRYLHGFTNISNLQTFMIYDEIRFSNQIVQFNVVYLIKEK